MIALPSVPRLLAFLALIAPLPLPFNAVLEWPVLALYLLFVGLVLRRLRRAAPPLSSWMMNLLGLLYLPVLLIDLRMVIFRGQIVQTVIHVCLFTIVIKLLALRSPRDVWQTFGAVFFLFLAAMGTSVHPTIVLYLLAFVVPALLLLVRLAMLRVLSRYERAGEVLERTPVGGFVAVSTLAALLVAIPLFVLFPRVSDPFVGIRGTGTGTQISAAGFTDEVTLDAIGGQRDNPDVAVRLQFEEQLPPGPELRLKGGAFEVFDGRRWRGGNPQAISLTTDDGRFRLVAREPRERVEVWLQPLGSRALILPVEAVTVELEAPVLNWERTGVASMWRAPTGVVAYEVGLASEPVLFGRPPISATVEAMDETDSRLETLAAEDPTLDASAISPRAAQLAAEVAGEGSARRRARRIEGHLITEYAFSLDFVGLTGDDPIDEFLFDHRQGHCELFATAMVLMLRSEGIPARLATGFLGAELNPLTGYHIVRQSNAHAWVEAYLPEEGWTIFDPTPPAGRPASSSALGLGLFRQAYDYVLFRWDRYVLTYGFDDQLSFLWGARQLWFQVREWWEDEPEPSTGADPAAADPAAQQAMQPPAAPPPPTTGRWLISALALALAALTLVLGLRQRRSIATGARAFRRLRRLLERRGLDLPPNITPTTLSHRAAERFPQVATPAARVVDLYLAESFGEQPLDDAGREELDRALAEARRELGRRKAG